MADLLSLVQALTPGGFLHTRTGQILRLDRVTFIEAIRAAARIHHLDGDPVEAADDHLDLFARLEKDPGWIRTHRDTLVQFRHVQAVRDLGSNRFSLVFPAGAEAGITAHYAPSLARRLGMETLEHITPFNRVQYWIMKEDLRDFDKFIPAMSVAELTHHFSEASSDTIVVERLIANFLWQTANFIREGRLDPLEGGNVRSLWYLIKPTLSRINALGGRDHYKTLSEKLALFTAKKIMTYREFGLIEEGNWKIGPTRPWIILTAEKRSHYRFLLKMQQEFGVSVIALGGKPKQITSEAFTAALIPALTRGKGLRRVHVIGLIDYDPSGDIIARSFIEDLHIFGLKKARRTDLVLPKNFTPEELEIYKYSLVQPDDSGEEPVLTTEIGKWLKKTGGINGEPYGLETDALMLDSGKVRRLVGAVING